MKTSFQIISAVSVATLLAATSARADSVPWGYSATDTVIFNNNNSIKGSSVAFAASNGVATNDSGIIIYNLTTSSSAADGSPDSFSNVPFHLAITVTDIKTTSSTYTGTQKVSGTFNFSGLFNATNVASKSLLPGAISWTTPTTATMMLGDDSVFWRDYTVTLSSFTPPGQPGGAPGSIQAVVTIAGAPVPDGGVDHPGAQHVDPAPEPASLVLAGIGLPLAVLFRRRRKSGRK